MVSYTSHLVPAFVHGARKIYCLTLFAFSQESREKGQLLEREFKSQSSGLSFLPVHITELNCSLNFHGLSNKISQP